MNKRSLSRHGLLLSLPLLIWFAGCSIVTVHDTSLHDHLAAQRNDVLRSGKLSAASRQALLVLGLDANACMTHARHCLERVEASRELDDERRLAALAELQLADALAAERSTRSGTLPLSLLDRYAEVARSSYAYLFFTARDPGERVFEDRQTQVRGFYNYVTERLASIVFQRRGDATEMRFETWQARLGSLRLRIAGGYRPQELLPTTRLRFVGSHGCDAAWARQQSRGLDQPRQRSYGRSDAGTRLSDLAGLLPDEPADRGECPDDTPGAARRARNARSRGTARASRGITLIGHSMGGVISRLLVVESGDTLWRSFFDKPIDAGERARFSNLEPYLTFAAAATGEARDLHSGSASWLARGERLARPNGLTPGAPARDSDADHRNGCRRDRG
jgi:hypothetical protein